MTSPKSWTRSWTPSWIRASLLVGLVSGLLGGCSYGDMVVHPKNGKLYIQRRDHFLFGALRKLYECTPDGNGHVACVALDGRP
ncbi:MAG: hypothetical protein JNK45_37015 [Myxococcales bacterium]|nr:hypothetical protein [Myxococcales bacterium]